MFGKCPTPPRETNATPPLNSSSTSPTQIRTFSLQRTKQLNKLFAADQYFISNNQEFIRYSNKEKEALILNYGVTNFLQQPLMSVCSMPQTREFLLLDPESKYLQAQFEDCIKKLT